MRQILFPIDFSPRCDAMAPLVAALARAFGANITLLHVMETGANASDFAPLEHHFGVIRETLQGRLDSYQSTTFHGLAVDRVFKFGHPVDEIVAYAEVVAADLVVLPTHGRSRFRELLLGSVTAGVLHDSPAAVLTAAHLEAMPDATPPKSLLCAIDLGLQSVDVLAMAAHVAQACGAALQVVHILSDVAAGLDGGLVKFEYELAAAKARADYAPLALAAEVSAPFEAVRGDHFVDSILAAEQRWQAGLLVIGRGQSQGLLGRLRTQEYELIRRSACPVLSV